MQLMSISNNMPLVTTEGMGRSAIFAWWNTPLNTKWCFTVMVTANVNLTVIWTTTDMQLSWYYDRSKNMKNIYAACRTVWRYIGSHHVQAMKSKVFFLRNTFKWQWMYFKIKSFYRSIIELEASYVSNDWIGHCHILYGICWKNSAESYLSFKHGANNVKRWHWKEAHRWSAIFPKQVFVHLKYEYPFN